MVEQLGNPTNNQEKSKEEPRVVNRDLNSIDVKEPKSNIDVSVYEGRRFKIEKVSELEVIDFYNGPIDAEGKPSYNPNSTELKHIIEIETEALPMIDVNGNPTEKLVEFGDDKKHLTVKARFNLKKDENGIWVISKHLRASLWKFMRKLQVERVGELKGKFVTITTEASSNPQDDRVYLRIVQ